MPLIYKYLPPERVTFFDDGLLRMTQPGDLNDPLECLSFHVDIDPVAYATSEFAKQVDAIEEKTGERLDPGVLKNLKNDITARLLDPSNKTRWLKGCYTSFIEQVDSFLGVVSFSKDWSSSTMWAHYAGDHNGFCMAVEQNYEPLPNCNGQIEYGNFYEVLYETERFSQKMVDSICVGDRSLFIKARDWVYESEVRVMFELASGILVEKKSKRGYSIYLKKIDQSSVKEILIGYHANEELQAKAISFARANHITAYKMTLSLSSSFALDRELLT